MNTSVLYPPNSQSLSDEVIQGATQRVEFSCHDRYNTRRHVPVKVRLNSPTRLGNRPLHARTTAELTARPPQHSTIVRAGKDASSSLGFAERSLLRRRQQSRENMTRYQRKMSGRVSGIRSLREETYKLELQRQLLDFGISTARTSWNVVSEYFRLFRSHVRLGGCNSFKT